jgi:hypothetical protein
MSSHPHALAIWATGTHWIGGWVGPRTSLDDMERRKILLLPGLKLPPLSHPAHSQLLYRLRYRSSLKGLRKTTKNLNHEVTVPAKIRTGHLNANQKSSWVTSFISSEQKSNKDPCFHHQWCPCWWRLFPDNWDREGLWNSGLNTCKWRIWCLRWFVALIYQLFLVPECGLLAYDAV